MALSDYDQWLAELLGQSEVEVRMLLRDETATQFLIAWALFESKCFGGFMRAEMIDDFSKRLIDKESFDGNRITHTAEHFHSRYQNKALYKNLMHGQKSQRMDELLKKSFALLSAEEKVFLVTLTTYRFRNNMFHGNKGVHSWLGFATQIDLCTNAMQAYVTHAEALAPSMKLPGVA